MEEENKKVDEKKEETEEVTEKTGKEETTDSKDDGVKYETTPVIERAREEREKLEVAIAAQKIENDRSEAIMVKRELGGRSEAGSVPEPKKPETDEEFTDKFKNGEVNLFK